MPSPDPRRVIVLSSKDQYEKFLAGGLKPSDYTILCDNERFYGFLEKNHIAFQKLDEYCIRASWSEINAWGFGRAAAWVGLGRKHKFFSGPDFAAVIYNHFAMSLSLMLKNYCLAAYLLDHFKPSSVTVFKVSSMGNYPDFFGNAFLNHFISELSAKQGVNVSALQMEDPVFKRFPESAAQRIKKTMTSILRQVIHFFYGWLGGRRFPKGLMVYGSVRHLASTMKELRSRNVSFVLYDYEFHKDIHFFALKNGIRYAIPQNFRAKNKINEAEFSASFLHEMAAASHHPAAQNFFTYQGHSFDAFIADHFFGSMTLLAKRLARQANHFSDVLDVFPVSGLLMDEDFNTRAFAAAFMRDRGIPVFCNSHAYVSLDFQTAESERDFFQSTTFVNSEHERQSYGWRGYDLSHVKVTGTPRYDRLLRLRRARKARLAGEPFKILFAASSLTYYSPDMLGYVGIDIFSYGYFQELTLKTALKSIEGLPAELVIKPHYTEDEIFWRRMAGEAPSSVRATVAPAAGDFFELLADADALLVANWSSTIIEAGICGIPTLYLDLGSENARPIREYAADGFCRIARSGEDLRQEISSLLKAGGSQKSPASPEKEEYYFGKRDEKNSARVVEAILEAHV